MALPAPWIMQQRWHDLLFAHWRCRIEDLRAIIPADLDIDTFDGSAWIGVIPFFMSGVRFRGLPPVPTAHRFAELNVRTYVTLDGKPGVWFFSLDCESSLAVLGARAGAHLPYFRATMRRRRRGQSIHYDSQRWELSGPSAEFSASYQPEGLERAVTRGSLDHFLTERYSLYASNGRAIWRGDIVHPPWQLQDASATITANSMISAAGVRVLDDPPVLAYSKYQAVRFWPLARVRH